MEHSFPTFLELKQFITYNSQATICEIRDKFEQHGDVVVTRLTRLKPNCKKKEMVLAYNINGDFFEYLQNFMKQDYVLCGVDKMACLISDNHIYTGPGQFLPIVLSIKSAI